MGILVCVAHGGAHACEKKGLGFVAVPFMKSADLLKSMNAHWYYDWTLQPLENSAGVPFIPMVNGVKFRLQSDLQLIAGHSVTPILLGYNEPDLQGKSQMTVDEATALWPQLERNAVRLGSPAASTFGWKWFDKFMSKIEQQDMKVDFIAFHYYGSPDAHEFLDRVDNLYKKYHRPIWITEFAIWNARWRRNPNFYTTRDVLRFMHEVMPELERRPYVERFAWWGIGGKNPGALRASRFFQDDGSLTEVGRYYASIEANPNDGLCGAP